MLYKMEEIVLDSKFKESVFKETDYDIFMDCHSMIYEDKGGLYKLEVNMRYTSRAKERTYVFVNNVYMINTSTVEFALRTALQRATLFCARKAGLATDDDVPMAETIREGLDCIIALDISDEEASPSADYTFYRPELRPEFEVFFQKNLEEYFVANPLSLKSIFETAMKETVARQAARNEYNRVRYNLD